MADLYDKDGNLVQGAMTADEIQAATRAAAEKEVAPLKDELTKAQEELKKLKDKDYNFSNLRQTAEEKEKKIVELENQIKDLTGQIDTKVAAAVNTNVAGEMISRLARGDKELEKKITLHFNETLKAVPGGTKEEIAEKLKSAYTLATRNEAAPDPLGSIISSGGASLPPKTEGSVAPIPAEVKPVASKMGLSEDDLKNPKYNK